MRCRRISDRGMYEEGKAAALRYEDIFGKGNFFLELQDHGIPEQADGESGAAAHGTGDGN